MPNQLACSPAFEKLLWDIRDILHKAVQKQMANDSTEAHDLTKEAYQRLATALNQLESNIVAPNDPE
ncbi:hypothetical protein DEM27_23790 [Metarhizobium album]|uniref:Uncharacterized protein n=1 Tax=Metarhizobium album TaxID=2182425 RepID=A0A2U2DKU8_9HYPH|nr:hypothetical protein DEM27_23790 [Rhizobium album]